MIRVPVSALPLALALALALALSGALAACGGSAPASNQAAAAPGPAPVDYIARLRALPPAQRDAVFLRAIRDAGQDCQGVTASAAGGATGGKPAWSATCTDGKTWVLILGADGTMTVLDPAQVRGAG